MSFSEWKEHEIGDFADILSGYAFKSKDFIEKGVPIIKIKNIVPPIIDINDVQYVSEELYKEKERYALNFNDILISLTGSNVNQIASAVGKIGRVRVKNEKLLLNQRIGKLYVTDKEKCDHNYLYYYLIQEEIRYNLAASAGGSANQANISPAQIKKIKVNLPSLEEQKAIAYILSSIDEKIEVNNQINKKLEEMAQAIFKQWFVDFEFPNENGEPYKSSGGEMVESEMGMIPKGWEVSTIENLAKLVSKGTTPRKKDIDKASDNKTVKFLKVKDIGDDGIVDLFNLEYIPESIHSNQLKRSMLEYKDVLISIAGTIGRVSYVNDELVDANTNQAVAFVRLKDIKKYFLLIMYKFKSNEFQDSVKSKVVQGVQANISLTVIKNEKLLVPKNDVLQKYNNIMNSIFNKEEILNRENNNLKNIRDTLLPKLMSGEIRVPLK